MNNKITSIIICYLIITLIFCITGTLLAIAILEGLKMWIGIIIYNITIIGLFIYNIIDIFNLTK